MSRTLLQFQGLGFTRFGVGVRLGFSVWSRARHDGFTALADGQASFRRGSTSEGFDDVPTTGGEEL